MRISTLEGKCEGSRRSSSMIAAATIVSHIFWIQCQLFHSLQNYNGGGGCLGAVHKTRHHFLCPFYTPPSTILLCVAGRRRRRTF